MFRDEITHAQRDASLNALLADVAAGVFAPTTPALAEMTIEAERLSAVHTEKLGARSLDILHVAAALTLGVSEFLTFDLRQAALARQSGLKAPKL